MEIFNTHIHTFTDKDVPRKFLPLGLVRILSSNIGFNIIAKTLNFLNPLSSDDQFKKYVRFATIGSLGSQQKIFEECAKFYPEDTKFVVLSVDMKYMDAGNVPREFPDQIEELGILTKKYPQIIPFIHIDPRRPGYFDLLRHAVEDLNYKGVKLYFPLGYFPTDERLDMVYEYCQRKNLPIISHCGPCTPTYNHSSKKTIRKWLGDYPYSKKDDKKTLCSHFANPKNYIPVLEKYPNLKICMAHFGSECSLSEFLKNPTDKENWFYIIKDMIQKYPNLYTDISFTLNNQEYFSVIKIYMNNETMREKILFGTDYYMVETAAEEKKFCFDLRAYLGEDYFSIIANVNPKKFLNHE